jgi:hypothetical protein
MKYDDWGNEINNMSKIEETGTKVIVTISVIVATIIIVSLVTLWYVFSNHRDTSPIQTLEARCERNGGIIIEGVNDDGANVNHFSVCVPFEALTCVDVE